MVIRLRDDVVFSDPESRIREYCEIEIYAGYDDRHSINNSVTLADISSANNLYAMIGRYDKNESNRILDQTGKLSTLLAEIPDTPIYQYSDEEWSNIKPKIQSLLVKMTSIHGVGIAKSTKILHLKRPELFPVLDSFVVQFLTGKTLSSSQRDISLAIKNLDISRELIQTQIIEFTELQQSLGDLPISLTMVRLFDILCWSTHKWDILRRTTAPRGRATKSLIDYQKTKPKITQSKIKSSFGTRKTKKITPSHVAQTVVIDFFNDLSIRAKYGVKGEKPIAVLSVLKYLKDTKQIGIRFLDLLDYPYYERVRKTFIEMAEKHGNLSNPSSSWGVITGSNRELQNAIIDNGVVNHAVYNLSSSEIESMYKLLIKKYNP